MPERQTLARSKTLIAWTALGLVAAALLYGALVLQSQLQPRAAAASGYMARVACACLFIGGRTLESCLTDKEAGMELVRLTVDRTARRAVAGVPLLASARAVHTPGHGCVLEK